MQRAAAAYTLTEERYVPIGVKRGAPQLWQVPVCARGGEARECTLLTGRTGTLALNGTAPWIMPNAGGRGYYRFDLDPASWDALIAAGPGLAPTEAMATADSLWASFTAGRAPFAQVVAGARAFATHKERYAATFLPNTLAALSQTEMSAADRDNYGRMVHTLFAPRLAELGLDLRSGAYAAEPSERRELRRVLANYVADEGKDADARGKFVSATQAYLGGDTAALDPAFRPLGLQIVARDGGAPMVQKLFDRLIASTDPQERSELVQALSGVGRADLAPRVLELSRDKRLNNLEGLRMGLGLAFDANTRDLAYTDGRRAFRYAHQGHPADRLLPARHRLGLLQRGPRAPGRGRSAPQGRHPAPEPARTRSLGRDDPQMRRDQGRQGARDQRRAGALPLSKHCRTRCVRHPGLDPGPTFFLAARREAGRWVPGQARDDVRSLSPAEPPSRSPPVRRACPAR